MEERKSRQSQLREEREEWKEIEQLRSLELTSAGEGDFRPEERSKVEVSPVVKGGGSHCTIVLTEIHKGEGEKLRRCEKHVQRENI